jgi:hypothetical protein
MATSVDNSKTGMAAGADVNFATGADIDEGTSEVLAVTPKAIADSGIPTQESVDDSLELKEDVANKSTDVGLGESDTAYPSQRAVKAYVDSSVVGLLNDRGNHDASGNTFPSSGGSGAAGAIKKGNSWYISVAGTLAGVAVNIGDNVRAKVDTPGQTASNWAVLEGNIGYVPERSIDAASSKTTLVDADTLGVIDSAAGNALKKITWANIKAAFWTAWGALIAAGTGKTTPVDADSLALSDSAASDATKKLTWANLKATLKTYFDTLYAPAITLVGVQTLSGQASRTWSTPNTAKRITAKVHAMSGSGGGTAPIQFRLGDAGGDETTGYLGAVAQSNSTSANLSYAAQTGFCVDTAAGAGGQVYYGEVTFSLLDPATNLWSMSGNLSNPGFVMHMAGTKALSQAITQITVVAPGTTFDGGSVNVSYE